MTTKIPAELSSTPGISDSSDATAITIDSSEKTTFSGKVDVNGNELILDADGDTSITADTDDQIDLKIANSTVGSIGNLSGLLGIGNGDSGLLMAGSVDAVAPYNASTNATRDAAINLGTSTNRFQDIFLSGGVNFSANANASGMSSELFDDYEEGTFTPTIVSGITSVGYGDVSGYYTKIGNLVMFNLRLTTGSGTPQSSTLAFGNLPFTSAATQQPAGAAMRAFSNSSFFTSACTFFIGPSSNTISVFQLSGSGVSGNDLGNEDALDIRITGIYRA